MSFLYFINFFIFQWLCIRVCRSVDVHSGQTKRYGVLYFVQPLSGWSKNYKTIYVKDIKVLWLYTRKK
jgi:hypothetical protein